MTTIGEAAAASGVPAKTIRYYEAIGLLLPAPRSAGGYRAYSEADIATLSFIGRARRLGFSVADLRHLLALWRDSSRTSREVKDIVAAQIARIDGKINELASMRRALTDLARRCHGDARPDCPILAEFAAPRRGRAVIAAAPHPPPRAEGQDEARRGARRAAAAPRDGRPAAPVR